MSEKHDTDLIRLCDITHAYGTGPSKQPVLLDVSLSIPAGQSCAIIGASGSGKSTLLNLIGLLDEPTTGHIWLAGEEMSRAGPDARAMARNRIIGFIFQDFNLLPRLDALDNVAQPLLYRGVPRHVARKTAQTQLAHVGLAERIHHRPADLSGGQRQRVAIARALVGEPTLLLADEPTGNLDSQTASDIIDLLLSLNQQRNTTLVLVTHDSRSGRVRR
ncbi:ABC transporter ATP-binding protein [Acerihabitans arboris]|uniref:ATP-binding cassette domain-containing protein n=1 Tax=Acerihabitans arboris TaxID=2691583 RepID=A0A845STF8_9GAMM|nr:ABC transporter ATP-binding protein [Acerihabitans arboris]NDL66028.1 ATP-binding cassette domain-containing protein [Acerihabitans arboris]